MDKKDTTPSGLGNQCSIEFNLAYRWHSATSAKDELWTENVYKELFGKLASEVSMPELLTGLGKYMNNLDKDPSKRTFAHLQRQEDGTFRDEDLVNILTEAIEDVAGLCPLFFLSFFSFFFLLLLDYLWNYGSHVSGSFGPRNIPKALRAVEILGIQQARKWNCGSLNEFRKFFGLKPYDTFEEINSDPYIADQLRHLYEHPDYVELYPGIIAEEAKEPMVPGVGIAPTYTISRAVLSDAVALVRGDRFYTVSRRLLPSGVYLDVNRMAQTDYNPKNLTNWGFNESNYDLSINQGCIFYKLALRAFPNYFKPNSIYAHYPMTIPSENKVIMKNLGRESHYCWDRPAFIQPRVNLTSYEAAKLILEDQKNFHVTWREATGFLFGKGGFDFMLSGDTPFHTRQREIMDKALYRDQWHKQVKEFYEYITLKLLHEKSCQIAGVNQVDITRE